MPAISPILGAAIFTGLIVLGAQVTVPLGSVPFVLSDFFVVLSGLVLPTRYALLSVGAYLVLGAVGLPVFAEGHGGWVRLVGPTGGYLIGFLVAAGVVGTISKWAKRSPVRDLLAAVSGYLTIYLFGASWLKYQLEMPWTTAIENGVLTFLGPVSMKIAVAVLIAFLLRRLHPASFA